ATRSLLRRAIVGQFSIPIAEAFMVLGCHHHVLLACLLGQLGPSPRSIGLRLENLGQLLVLEDREPLHLHGPLMMTNHAVKAPVNKHAELGFMPPFHSALTVCLDLGAFLLSLARLACRCSPLPAIRIEPRRCKGSSGSHQEKGITSGNLVF